MAYAIVRKPHMNRVYITGEVGPLRDLLSDMGARTETVPADHPHSCEYCTGTGKSSWGTDCHGCDGIGVRRKATVYWLPLHQERKLRAALEKEAEYQAGLAAAISSWEAEKAVIPADYMRRHGAAYGGDVVIDGEVVSEPALDTTKLPWTQVACHETRVRDLTGQSLINGRVMNRDTLYCATVADGRRIYRIAHYAQFGDDLRETYYLPPDLWEQMALAEIRLRKITPESARAWLAQSRGCVGTELYEFAATLQPAPKMIP